MVEIYISCHGIMSTMFGYFVPKNGKGNVNINLLNYPGTTSCLFIKDITKADTLLTYSSGDFIFDIAVSLDNYDTMFVTTDKLIANGKKKGELKDRYIFLKGYKLDKNTHPILKRTDGNKSYMFSNLLYTLERLYPGQNLDIKINCCLEFDMNFECKSIGRYFNIFEKGFTTFNFEHIPDENIKQYLKDNIVIDCLKNGIDNLDISGDDINDYGVISTDSKGVYRKLSEHYIKIDGKAPKLLKFFKDKYDSCKKETTEETEEDKEYNSIIFANSKNKKYKYIKNFIEVLPINEYEGFNDYKLSTDINNNDIDSVYIFKFKLKSTTTYTTDIKNNSEYMVRHIKSRSLKRTRELPNLVVDKSINIGIMKCILKHIHNKEYLDKKIKINGEDYLKKFIENMEKINSEDIIIIPYQFICYIFFNEEPRLGSYFPDVETKKDSIIEYIYNFCKSILNYQKI